ncbi:MAG: phospholipase D family protein, partial [Gammaproteobacteria bacterium]|nr:phospholipase D family protein [Gammaproteobacteria bacterium]
NISNPESYVMSETDDSRLGTVFDVDVNAHTANSGFAILNDGREAFVARAGLADLAEHSIDAQYYLWNGDKAGQVLLEKLVAAAQRGVRVRILIDDTYAIGSDFEIAALDSLSNMEVRLFNPYAQRHKYAVFRRGFEFFTNLSRLNHRMHNKVFAVDNKVAIVGGRNIGDEYFGASETFNFRDLDLLAVGPVVGQVSAGFDQYWNSNWAYPASALTKKTPSSEDTSVLLEKLRQSSGRYSELHKLLPTGESDSVTQLARLRDALIWAPAEVISDPPSKTENVDPEAPSVVTARLADILADTHTEVLAESAYFVPGRRGVERLNAIAGRGVAVKILTNSLASTNHAVAHTGYKRYRKALLAGGVQLFEVQPRARSRDRYTLDFAGDHSFGLHTKAVVFDRRVVFVGTLNLDPRSVNLNTEMGLVVYSELLAQRLAELMDDDMRPENSWQVSLQDNKLSWTGEQDGQTVVYRSEPESRFGRKLTVFFASLFPIEKQL